MQGAKNGLILHSEEGELLYQEENDERDELERFAAFLWTILDYYGPSTSRYSAKRIYIDIRPGDKYEDYKGNE